MRMKIKIINLLTLLTFVSCSNDENFVSDVMPRMGEVMQVSITVNDYIIDGTSDTRATDDENTTTFEEGDCVGIIILDQNDTPLYNNIPYKYDGKVWKFDSTNEEGKEACYYDPNAWSYIVYYPYTKDANGCKSESDLKNVLSPKANQRNKADYRASDLMMWKNISETPKQELNAALTHVYASVSLVPKAGFILDNGHDTPCVANISDVNFTIGDNVYIPYQAPDGSLRCVFSTDFTGEVLCYYTVGKVYINTINMPEVLKTNTRYNISPLETNAIYSFDNARLGDFYCKRSGDIDSYLIPGETSLNIDQQKDCIGIVCYAGHHIHDSSNYLSSGIGKEKCHGYAIALINADNDKLPWTYRATDGSYDQKIGNSYDYAEFNGYINTKRIEEFANSSTSWTLTDFPAANSCIRFGMDNNQAYAAPLNSSGWFFPSLEQLGHIRDNLTLIFNRISGWNSASPMDGGRYWSSSENLNTDTNAFFIELPRYSGGATHTEKKYRYRVRAMIAF